jgi:hypothetical protein
VRNAQIHRVDSLQRPELFGQMLKDQPGHRSGRRGRGPGVNGRHPATISSVHFWFSQSDLVW